MNDKNYEWPEYIENWEKAWEEGGVDGYSHRRIGCLICRHHDPKQIGQCKAFPYIPLPDGRMSGGIPAPVFDGTIEHFTPINDDNGIRFEPLTPNERVALEGTE